MNVKELETKCNALEAMITAQGGALENLGAEVEAVKRATGEGVAAMSAALEELREMLTNQGAAIAALSEQLEGVTDKVEGRNRSSASKRNMTDADAERVLVGDLKDLDHKKAAEAAGLTYAQVYSCRGEFTFKGVHKTLREDRGFKNPWAKK